MVAEEESFKVRRQYTFLLPATIMSTPYLIFFAQAHEEFRIPEILSIAELHKFRIIMPEAAEERDPSRPFMIAGLEDEEHARILAGRCILVR